MFDFADVALLDYLTENIRDDKIFFIASQDDASYSYVYTAWWRQGRSDGGISVYIPPQTKKNQSTLQIFMWLLVVLFTCGTLTCFDFEISMTS